LLVDRGQTRRQEHLVGGSLGQRARRQFLLVRSDYQQRPVPFTLLAAACCSIRRSAVLRGVLPAR
jgi:hypothetical protein